MTARQPIDGEARLQNALTFGRMLAKLYEPGPAVLESAAEAEFERIEARAREIYESDTRFMNPATTPNWRDICDWQSDRAEIYREAARGERKCG